MIKAGGMFCIENPHINYQINSDCFVETLTSGVIMMNLPSRLTHIGQESIVDIKREICAKIVRLCKIGKLLFLQNIFPLYVPGLNDILPHRSETETLNIGMLLGHLCDGFTSAVPGININSNKNR